MYQSYPRGFASRNDSRQLGLDAPPSLGATISKGGGRQARVKREETINSALISSSSQIVSPNLSLAFIADRTGSFPSFVLIAGLSKQTNSFENINPILWIVHPALFHDFDKILGDETFCAIAIVDERSLSFNHLFLFKFQTL
jgi:hypothetical protein